MEPSTFKVASLVDKCVRGEFLLPEIQRGFVWKRSQIRDLVDSIYHDYPTGSILAWEAENPPRARPIGGDSNKSSNGNVELLILDGQQRLTALYSLFGNPINGKSISIIFNIDTERFEYSERISVKMPWVSVTDVLKKGAISVAQEMNLLSDPSIGDYLNRLNRLERIKEYTYQVYILRKVDYQQVTDIFQRVNSKGTRLQQSELAIAQLAFSLPGLISDKMNAFVTELERKGFSLRLPFFVRCLQAVFSYRSNIVLRADFKQFQTILRESNFTDQELANSWEQTRKAIEGLVNILRSNLGIQSSKWLASENALVVPVLYLAISPNPDTKSMITWFLHASMWGRYSGAAETALDQDFALLLESTTPSFRQLLKQVRREVKEEDLRRAGIQSPFHTMLYLACRANKAQDWSKEKVIIHSTGLGDNSLQVHHIFPTAHLKRAKLYSKPLANQLANLAFISRSSNLSISSTDPVTYLAELKRRDERLLTAHFIPTDQKLWASDRFRTFLYERRKQIARGINEFINNLEIY